MLLLDQRELNVARVPSATTEGVSLGPIERWDPVAGAWSSATPAVVAGALVKLLVHVTNGGLTPTYVKLAVDFLHPDGSQAQNVSLPQAVAAGGSVQWEVTEVAALAGTYSARVTAYAGGDVANLVVVDQQTVPVAEASAPPVDIVSGLLAAVMPILIIGMLTGAIHALGPEQGM